MKITCSILNLILFSLSALSQSDSSIAPYGLPVIILDDPVVNDSIVLSDQMYNISWQFAKDKVDSNLFASTVELDSLKVIQLHSYDGCTVFKGSNYLVVNRFTDWGKPIRTQVIIGRKYMDVQYLSTGEIISCFTCNYDLSNQCREIVFANPNEWTITEYTPLDCCFHGDLSVLDLDCQTKRATRYKCSKYINGTLVSTEAIEMRKNLKTK